MQMEQMPSASSETGPEELTLIPSLVPVEPQPKGSMACGPSACYFAEVVLAYLLPESAEPEWLEWAALSTARELKAVGNIPAADYLERRNHYKTVLCDLSAQYIKVRYIPSNFTLIGSHPISRLAYALPSSLTLALTLTLTPAQDAPLHLGVPLFWQAGEHHSQMRQESSREPAWSEVQSPL